MISKSPAGGYRLDVPPELIDARRFDQLVVRARALSRSDPKVARELLVRAEELWGGEPLAGLGGQWAEATRQALLERRRGATLTRIELELLLGGHSDDLISELTGLTGTGRVDQNAVGLLMTALNAAGRTDDASAAYQRARVRLRDELGVDPRPELRVLHQRILRGDLGVTPQPHDESPSPDTLDRDPPYLTGRDRELTGLLAAVVGDLRSGSRTAIYALDGMPGIGKTTLAVRAAHRLRSHCPDGLLQINLRTHHPHQAPLGPAEALTQLLDAVGTPSRELGRADSPDALAALWRRRSSGRHLLIILDDVQDAEQIEPLLPATAGSVVLLTSRRRLTGLAGSRQHTLGVLPDDAARELLADVTGRRFAPHGDDVEQFARHCGGLPLAITVAAAYLRTRPMWTLDDLNTRLATTPPAPDDHLTARVHAAFAMSCDALPEHLRTLLWQMAAHPGLDIGLHAAAALSDIDLATADLSLDALVEHHLLDETSRHRYRLHDLLRHYALNQLGSAPESEQTEAALSRVLDFYIATATQADRALRPHRRPEPARAVPLRQPIALTTPTQARTWLDSESENLIAVTAYAHQRGWSDQAATLPHVIARHLDRRGRWRQGAAILQRALDDNAALPAPIADETTAELLTDLAAAHIREGELALAVSCALTALETWRACHDEYGQAEAGVQLGRAHWHARRPAEAIAAYEQAIARYEQIGDRGRAAAAEDHLSVTLFELGRFDDAFTRSQRALDTARALDDPALQCDVLTNLGEMHRQAEHYDRALLHFQEAQVLADLLGDPHNTAVLANNVGAVHDHSGEHAAAQASFRTALHLFRTLGDQRNEIDSLINLAAAHTHLADHAAALDHLRDAAALAESVHDPLRHARIHLATGNVHLDQDRRPEALASYRTALAHARRADSPLDQAHILRAIGDVLAVHDPASAGTYWRQAGEIYRRLGHPDAHLADAEAPDPARTRGRA